MSPPLEHERADARAFTDLVERERKLEVNGLSSRSEMPRSCNMLMESSDTRVASVGELGLDATSAFPTAEYET